VSLLWSYFWPPITAGLVIGLVGGLIAFRRARKRSIPALGLAVALAAAALWHGAAGAADKFSSQVDRTARASLDYYEMSQVQGRLQRDPLSRRLLLSGRADDFQRTELVRLMSDLPGVSRATWSPTDRGLPLIAEAALAATTGYLFGLLLAYLVVLRRRYNEQWSW
jgi:hypothetical protein